MHKLLVLIFIFSFTWSADLHLFDSNAVFDDNFATKVLTGDLTLNERIYIKDKSLIYRGILGSGNTTLILRVYDPQTGKELALRLPHGNSDYGYTLSNAKDHINYTHEGHEQLKTAGVAIPNIHSYEKDSYLLVDLIEHDFTLKTYLARNEYEEEASKSIITNSLIDFFKSTAIFQSIADFHFDQVVYSREANKWYLLDWGPQHIKASDVSDPRIVKGFHIISNNYALDENGDRIYTIGSDGNKMDVFRNISEYENNLFRKLENEVKNHRKLTLVSQSQNIEQVIAKLNGTQDHRRILEIYKETSPQQMSSFYSQLQKDFTENQLMKFPAGSIDSEVLNTLLDNIGEVSPGYFVDFSESLIQKIEDLDTFMVLYNKMISTPLDEELEDDLSIIIAKNLKRIVSNTYSNPRSLSYIEQLKTNHGLINYPTRELLNGSEHLLKSSQNCQDLISAIVNAS